MVCLRPNILPKRICDEMISTFNPQNSMKIKNVNEIPDDQSQREKLQRQLSDKSLKLIENFQSFYKEKQAYMKAHGMRELLGEKLNKISDSVLGRAKEASLHVMQVVDKKYTKDSIYAAYQKVNMLDEAVQSGMKTIDLMFKSAVPSRL